MPSSLTSDFVKRIHTLKTILDEVFPKSLDVWVHGFELDVNPEKELLIWECIALTYSTFVESRPLSMEAKKQVINILLQCSLGRTMEYILNSNSKVLGAAEVLNLFTLYRASAEATLAVRDGKSQTLDLPAGNTK